MKRYSTLLLLACWLVILFVISTVKLSIDYSKHETNIAAMQKVPLSGSIVLNSH